MRRRATPERRFMTIVSPRPRSAKPPESGGIGSGKAPTCPRYRFADDRSAEWCPKRQRGAMPGRFGTDHGPPGSYTRNKSSTTRARSPLRGDLPEARFWLTSELPTTRQEQYLSGVGGAALRKPVWRSRCLAEISASSCLIGWSRSSEKGVESRPGIFTGHELDSLAQQTHSSA